MSPVNNRFKQFIGFGTMVALIGVGLYTGLQNVSKAGSQVVGCTQGCGAESDHTGTGEFKVMSLNMLHGYPDFDHLKARLGLIADEIRRQDADVVCLQEAPWRPGIGYASENLADMTGMNYVYLRANGNKGAIRFEEGVAILSRYPILGTGFTELSPRAGFFENRVALHALVDAPQGPLDVFVTHLTHGDERN